ncbi:hypothetical protein FQV33_01915 [Buchnera aphidicola (Aphis fabae)]|uniref:Uncharacterized protein n=1 Tax=Buchnera aphidicola (Aphis fabae) TaxID=571430 RepID=A0A5J6ZBH0_9GAMM|nr:hypothetical protein [Buchnera aphidicola]QFQ32730.1 hypothetical protein FQV33_01915 [Buchnera aphidicola (Aphis fabae)]
MSSNVNLVDKLNPISFEQNEPNDKLKIKIDPKIIESIRKEISETIKNNKNKNQKDSKITISYSDTEEKLVKLEKLYNKCLDQLEFIEKNAIKQKQGNEININNTNELNTENALKKKLFLNPLLNFLPKHLLNQLLNLF